MYLGQSWVHHDTKDDLEFLKFDPPASAFWVLSLKYANHTRFIGL